MQLEDDGHARTLLQNAVSDASNGGDYDLQHRSTKYNYDEEERALYITIGPDQDGSLWITKNEAETLRRHGFTIAGSRVVESGVPGEQALRVWFHITRIK